MSEKPLDLDALRATIAAAPAEGPVAGVSRAWLEQVERELSQGRADRALLQAHLSIYETCETIRGGYPA